MADRAERRERMREVLGRWQRSGGSAVRFCRRHGIHPQKLSYWNEFSASVRRGGTEAARTSARTSFVPVQLGIAGFTYSFRNRRQDRLA